MLIPCPQCQHGLKLKAAKPGRFQVPCPRCATRLLLVVPADPGQSPVVTPLAPEPVAPGGRSDGTSVAPLPPTPSSAPTAAAAAETSAPPAADGADPDATGGPTEPVATAPEIPTLLGGYQVLQPLGRGGMGAVYLARQLSLDRQVALKVMRLEWARDPRFVARFTREAYAAAQLVHHNVVQIYDFGEDKGLNFFSMEYVPGPTFSRLIRRQGKLDPEVAVGYMLQAARGLKFAHDRGMIHRDIKPENLMLNDQGIVKVADLGLVKTPGDDGATAATERLRGRLPVQGSLAAREAAQARDISGVTRAHATVGTPAYMPPEQAQDAAAVDQRADIYALGCTLYALVTGRPPFEGKTGEEIITKHATEPVVPPDLVVQRVPKALSAIILKMVAKRPEDRYADLGEVIAAFEEFLGVSSTGPFTPREEHAEVLEASVQQFHSVPLARQRPKILLGFCGVCALFVLLGVLAGKAVLAGSFVGLAVLTALAYFVVDGITRKTYLFLKVRELVFGSSLVDWLTMLAGLVLLVVLLVVFDLLGVWLAFCGAAVLLAVGFHILVDRRVDQQRRGPLERVEALLKDLRRHGLEEDALRQFVCKYSGPHWEEFYEALFGYEAKVVARARWGQGERVRARPKWGVWREPILQAIEAKQRARREARERRLLEAIEEKNLEAQGVNLLTARRRAKRAAEAMVSRAAELKQESQRASLAEAPTLSPEELRRRVAARLMDAAAEKPEEVLVHVEVGRREPGRIGDLLNRILGPRPRFLVGALLLAGCLGWMHQNGLISGREIQQIATEAIETHDASQAQAALESKVASLRRVSTAETEPLRLPLVPAALTNLFRDFSPGVAGLILIVSSFFRGWRMSLFVVPAAALALFGRTAGIAPIRLPVLGTIGPAASSLGLGVALAALGLLFGRSRRP